jgi:hypothetical protein
MEERSVGAQQVPSQETLVASGKRCIIMGAGISVPNNAGPAGEPANEGARIP